MRIYLFTEPERLIFTRKNQGQRAEYYFYRKLMNFLVAALETPSVYRYRWLGPGPEPEAESAPPILAKPNARPLAATTLCLNPRSKS